MECPSYILTSYILDFVLNASDADVDLGGNADDNNDVKIYYNISVVNGNIKKKVV